MAYLWRGVPDGSIEWSDQGDGWEVRGGEPGGSADRLRAEWRARSMLSGWSRPEDWWTPAVEAVAEAVCGGDGLALACTRLGAARDRAGVGVGETLDDLGALFEVLGRPAPPLPLVRCVAEGWVDSGLMSVGAESCEDPLTGLVTLSYLRSRLSEIYRDAGRAERSVADTYCLVLADLADGSAPWRRLARAVVVAHDLRMIFDGGETLALIGRARAGALVPRTEHLEFQIATLRRLLLQTLRADHGTFGRPNPLVWTELLPPSLPESMTLLDDLSQ